MIHYHVWFSFQADVPEGTGLSVARAFVTELAREGRVAQATLLKNSGQPPSSRLGPYHALFEFADRAQMDAAFAARRGEGIQAGAHGALMAVVAEFHVEVFHTVEPTDRAPRVEVSTS
ncbi:MAG TPA: DUF6614 family protein [Opitutus sp.]|nr:DUF6614 family protein [Opitutus sp.]